MTFFLPFVIGLMLLAVIFRQDAVLTVLYLLVGVYLGGRWWSESTLHKVTYTRKYTPRSFLHQKIPVDLEIKNNSWLPIVWMQAHESLPLQLISPAFYQQAITIGPKSSSLLHYELNGRKRGYYPLGPLHLTTGDLLGMSPDVGITGSQEFVTVYPQIVPMRGLNMVSASPYGDLRSSNPINEDASRILGKRDYVMGDSLRRVDWKATAVVGRMQVKTFQPSMALETVICLNANLEEYNNRTRFDLAEVAVITAASTANWLVRKKQPVGLLTNGLDPLAGHSVFQSLPARKGSGQLMSILDVLARVEFTTEGEYLSLVRREMTRLPWGTTLLLITGKVDTEIQETIFQAGRMGLNAGLILVGLFADLSEIVQRGRRHHFRVWNVQHQDDLEGLE